MHHGMLEATSPMKLDKSKIKRNLLMLAILQLTVGFGLLCLLDVVSPSDRVDWQNNLGRVAASVVSAAIILLLFLLYRRVAKVRK